MDHTRQRHLKHVFGHSLPPLFLVPGPNLLLMSGPELVAPDLSGRRQRHLVDELHLTRVLVCGQAGLDEGLDVGREPAVPLDALLGCDVRLDHLPPDLIRYTDYSRHGYGGMLDEGAFDLGWTDPIARGVDDVVLPPGEMEVPLVIDPSQVSGQEPVTDVLLPRRVGVLPVTEEHHRIGPLDRDLAGRVRVSRFAEVVDDRYAVAGIALAHAPRLDRIERRGVADHVVALGLAVDLVDGHSEALPDPVQHLLSERLPPAHDRAQPEVRWWPCVALPHQLQRGRGKKRVANRVRRHAAHGSLGIKGTRGLHAEGAAAVMEGRKEGVHQTAAPCPGGWGPEEVLTLGGKVMGQLKAREMAEEDAVTVKGALGGACGSAGVDQQGWVVGPGCRSRKDGRSASEHLLHRRERTRA